MLRAKTSFFRRRWSEQSRLNAAGLILKWSSEIINQLLRSQELIGCLKAACHSLEVPCPWGRWRRRFFWWLSPKLRYRWSSKYLSSCSVSLHEVEFSQYRVSKMSLESVPLGNEELKVWRLTSRCSPHCQEDQTWGFIRDRRPSRWSNCWYESSFPNESRPPQKWVFWGPKNTPAIEVQTRSNDVFFG